MIVDRERALMLKVIDEALGHGRREATQRRETY